MLKYFKSCFQAMHQKVKSIFCQEKEVIAQNSDAKLLDEPKNDYIALPPKQLHRSNSLARESFAKFVVKQPRNQFKGPNIN